MGHGEQHYMTRDERHILEGMYMAGAGVTEIARRLGFCRQTIYNEIKRGLYTHQCDYWDEVRYSADKAQQIHNYNQTAKGRPLKIGNDHAYAQFLEDQMRGVQPNGKIDKQKRCSPAVALELARRKGYTTSVCTSTLYNYIDKQVFMHLTNKDLWEKGRKKTRGQKAVRRIAHPTLPSITARPEVINQRQEPGHWEMDMIVSRATGSGAIMTLTERKSRREMIFKLLDKKAATIRGIFDHLEKEIPDFYRQFRSITTDNGPEFLEYDKLVSSIHGGKRFEIYYCHSYAAWEKGSNENHNRMIRRWFPKGTDFKQVSERKITELEEWMNNYPRKSLGWKTPLEAAMQRNQAHRA